MGSSPLVNTIGIVVVTALAASAAAISTRRGDHVDLTANQISRQPRQTVGLTVRPARFDGDVLPLDVARFVQAFSECIRIGRESYRRLPAEKSDHRHRRLLRTRCERPRGRCTAEKRHELASSHVRSQAQKRG